MNKEHLTIFDTTLRDGEQSPGASMTGEEKLRIAMVLEKMKVDVIEAGFAIANKSELNAIDKIAQTIRESVICSLARARSDDIDIAGQSLRTAQRPRIHTFIATSPLHMQYKLKMTPAQVLEATNDAVRRARRYTDDVEFSCEDASRSDFDFLCRVIETAITAGATTINIPDTVGYGEPHEFGMLIQRIMEKVPAVTQIILSVHCHNDLGLAVANSLSAVRHGARQIECTINGIGERAGNAALEEIVMAIHTRSDLFPVTTAINTQQIVPASRLLSNIIGFPVQPNKAIVGANAFTHEAGIHQDGVLKKRDTYEIMRAEDVGLQSNKLVLGKHSGKSALRDRLQQLGILPDDDSLFDEAYQQFKILADKKHDIYDEDLYTVIGNITPTAVAHKFHFISLDAQSSTHQTPSATIRLAIDGTEYSTQAPGSGPIDATFSAIEKKVASGSILEHYLVNSISGGTDSQGEVTVRLQRNGHIANGTGADTDIIIASAKAYINALNILENCAGKSGHLGGV